MSQKWIFSILWLQLIETFPWHLTSDTRNTKLNHNFRKVIIAHEIYKLKMKTPQLFDQIHIAYILQTTQWERVDASQWRETFKLFVWPTKYRNLIKSRNHIIEIND